MTWNNLSMSDKARIMQLAVKDGITDLRNIISTYEYATGGQIPPTTYEEEPEFNGPAIPSNMYNGPKIPYGFYDEPIDWERKKALQHYTESGFKANQVSQAGAMGPYQIMPKNWAAYSKKLGLTGSAQDYNNSEAVRDKMMDELLNAKWVNKGFPSDSVRAAKALMGYNWGSGNATKFLEEMKKQGVDIYHSMDWIDKIPNSETRNYVNYILRERNIPGKTIADFEKALPHRFDAYPEVHRFDMGGPENTPQYKRPKGSSLIKDLAYRIGTYEPIFSEGAAKPSHIIKALSRKEVPIDDNKYAYIFGTGDRYPEVNEPIQGFDYSNYLQKYGYKGVKNVYGIINPTNEYHIDPELKGLAEELAKHKYHFYDNADINFLDSDPDTLGYRDDVANFIHQLDIDKNGNVVVHDSDVYDFNPADYEYSNKVIKPIVKLEATLMDNIGTPYIIRQENQPLYFDTNSRTGSGITKHLSYLSEEDIANITGAGILEPAYIEAEHPNPDYDPYDYASGGKIHIKPENRGKFTALKKRTGKSASWFKAHGTPAQKKMAVFALNSKHWGRRKANGGSIFFNTEDLII